MNFILVTVFAILLVTFLNIFNIQSRHPGEKKPSTKHALCVLDSVCSTKIKGKIDILALNETYTQFSCDIHGLPPGKHGFHVHTCGDLRNGCSSTCGHYNPDQSFHGSAVSRIRHRGDLGNITANKDGRSDSVVIAHVAIDEIVGRSIVIHENEDDLGLNNTKESKKTGSSGERIACGIIFHT